MAFSGSLTIDTVASVQAEIVGTFVRAFERHLPLLERLKKEVDGLEKQLEAAEGSRQASQQQVVDLKARAEDMRRRHERETASLRTEIDHLSSKLGESTTARAIYEQEVSDLKAQIHDLEQKRIEDQHAHQQETATLRRQLESLETARDAQRAEASRTAVLSEGFAGPTSASNPILCDFSVINIDQYPDARGSTKISTWSSPVPTSLGMAQLRETSRERMSPQLSGADSVVRVRKASLLSTLDNNWLSDLPHDDMIYEDYDPEEIRSHRAAGTEASKGATKRIAPSFENHETLGDKANSVVTPAPKQEESMKRVLYLRSGDKEVSQSRHTGPDPGLMFPEGESDEKSPSSYGQDIPEMAVHDTRRTIAKFDALYSSTRRPELRFIWDFIKDVTDSDHQALIQMALLECYPDLVVNGVQSRWERSFRIVTLSTGLTWSDVRKVLDVLF
ncbi:hypothetical protein GQ53DRAFT_367186 [Thozetella sp. PMI_491]|nr:hypothetical protein GQ53DRAFT_367186 [Thozetella sp. PMI_491]